MRIRLTNRRQADNLIEKYLQETGLLLVLSSDMSWPHHLNAILDELASILIDGQSCSLSMNLWKYAVFVATLTIFKNGAEYKDAKLIVTHLLKMINNSVRSILHKNWVALFKHPLDNTTTVLVQAISNNVLFNLMDEVNKWLRLYLLTHLLDDLLHHMISVETEGAIFNLSLVK